MNSDQGTNGFYAALMAIVRSIHLAEHFDSALPEVEPAILDLLNAERVTIYQRDVATSDIVSRYKSGDDLAEIRVPISNTSLAGYVALTGKSLNISDVRDANELKSIHPQLKFDDRFERRTAFRSRSMLVVPIFSGQILLGVLQLMNRKSGGAFTEGDEERARKLAELIGQKFKYDLGCTSSPYEGLVRSGVVQKQQLKKLTETMVEGRSVGELLLALPNVTKADLGRSLELFYQAPFLPYDPDEYQLHPVSERINPSFLKANHLVLLAREGDEGVTLLTDDPSDTSRIMLVENILGDLTLRVCCGLRKDIQQYLGLEAMPDVSQGNLSSLLDELEEEPSVDEFGQDDSDEVSEEDSTVVKLVNRVLADGRRLRASDIHIEPAGTRAPTRVRMRIDGVCQEIIQIPASHSRAVIARLKVMAKLDIAERRLPQDGKFSTSLKGHRQEVRVATIPTVHGEGVVLRLLQTGEPLKFDDLNLSDVNREGITEILRHPHGIFLVVGPTGSGKTTTLHAVLARLNSPDRKIWTAEDPVEITQPGLQQVQVKPVIGFTFASALRAFLRADPDVILIGEMRDPETAHAAVEASLTGHLVLSTLHTNSAPETITRLLDLGIDPVSFADALLGILAQRLVRTLCEHCKEEYPATPEQVQYLQRLYGKSAWVELNAGDEPHLYRPSGCSKCNETGYRGRIGIHELLISDPGMRDLVYRKASVSEIKAAAINSGMRTLLQDGVRKVIAGKIDLEQLHRVAV